MPPISVPRDLGAFPLIGPVTYMHGEVRELLDHIARRECPPRSIWFHATTERVARAAIVEGLLPSCWRGGDSCCVFGYSSRDDVPRRRERDWVLEIESPALPGQLKAWWVPPQAIRGAWREGHFYSRDELALGAVAGVAGAAACDTCACELGEMTRQQIQRWHETCERRRAAA